VLKGERLLQLSHLSSRVNNNNNNNNKNNNNNDRNGSYFTWLGYLK